MLKPRRITAANFKKFGRIIEYQHKPLHKRGCGNLFCVVLREKEPFGWRIAYLLVRERRINRLEQHLHTFESFEPVRGRCLIYLSEKKDPKRIECFYLDRPVVLYKGIWHGVVATTPEAEVKISENAFVRSLYWPLKFYLGKPQ